MTKTHAFALTTASTLLAIASAFAQPTGQTGGTTGAGRPHGPPPEAIAACDGKAVGTTVSFTGRDGRAITGTCQQDNGVLAARPAGMPARPPASSTSQ